MRKNMDWTPGPRARILAIDRDGDRWVIAAVGPEIGSCPGCREPSTRRHSRYFRHLQDLPTQGAAVMVKMQASRWRCLNGECERQTFTDQLPEIVVLTLVGPNKLLNLSISSATVRPGGRREINEASRHAGQRRHHPTVSEAPSRPSPCEDDSTGGRHRRLGLAKRDAHRGPILSTWSGARLSMCRRIARPPEQPNGSVSTLRSKLSAAIVAVFMRRAHEKARLRRGR